jgi:enamine deaminase RidA (YjgF/YER057c/UK114 family)
VQATFERVPVLRSFKRREERIGMQIECIIETTSWLTAYDMEREVIEAEMACAKSENIDIAAPHGTV